MALVTCLFIAGMLALIAAAWYGGDEVDELADDADRRDWIDFLARESRKGHRTSRSRYGVSGLQK